MKKALITGANKSIGLEYELHDTQYKVNVVDPGYTATDFNNHSGPGTVERDWMRSLNP
ncbi:hypothetical protein [Kamptonema sp. UHCC 0994]|uniref:hypothetical protein n=1 Tax=Kamptonema sp. UHCC 0994 TaxID=3031329 RepID=UPI0023BA3E07|nr:hypothetical protein [Kamptonema sp. UHCC 0994]MDF0556422.1 hypothetical protein [Kamptonema sp. UHCC 0994]